MSIPKEIRVAMVCSDPLLERVGLERMLAALVSAGAGPTHAGMREAPADAFDMHAFVERVATQASTSSMPSIDRREEPRYTGYFNPQREKLSFVQLHFEGRAAREAFAAADALASALAFELGFAHPIVSGAGRDWNRVANTTAHELQDLGIEGICARTYFGPHLVSLVGADRIRAAGGRLVGPRAILDLAPEPWKTELATLAARQAEVTTAFEPAGVFCDLAERRPGARWTPIPL